MGISFRAENSCLRYVALSLGGGAFFSFTGLTQQRGIRVFNFARFTVFLTNNNGFMLPQIATLGTPYLAVPQQDKACQGLRFLIFFLGGGKYGTMSRVVGLHFVLGTWIVLHACPCLLPKRCASTMSQHVFHTFSSENVVGIRIIA